MVSEIVPTSKSVSKPPDFDGFIRQTALSQVSLGGFTGAGFQHLLPVISDAIFQHLADLDVHFLVGFHFRRHGLKNDASFVGQVFKGFREIPPLFFHYKAKQVPAFIALPKAAPGLGIRKDYKSRGAGVTMEGAETYVILARAPQFNTALGDKVHNIELCFNVIYNGHGFLITRIPTMILTEKIGQSWRTATKKINADGIFSSAFIVP